MISGKEREKRGGSKLKAFSQTVKSMLSKLTDLKVLLRLKFPFSTRVFREP